MPDAGLLQNSTVRPEIGYDIYAISRLRSGSNEVWSAEFSVYGIRKKDEQQE
jgi:hypothetical protein